MKKSNSLFHDHGIGLGLRARHMGLFRSEPPRSVRWVEALTENYLSWDQCPRPRALQSLLQVRRNLPVALHGVSLSLGSTDPLNIDYLNSLKKLADEIHPLWISDHLCWTSHGGESFHDLLPLPCTSEAIEHVVERISRVQDFLGRRILLENLSSYVEYEASEMREWEFLAEIAGRADCGILLDVNNVYVNSVNHGFDPTTYLRAMPRERIGQIHLAGHADHGSYLVDTHDQLVCDRVWDLYRWTTRHFGGISAMVEWDAQIPEFEILEAELEKARLIRQEELKAHAPVAHAFRDSISI